MHERASQIGLTFAEHIAYLERAFPDATGEFSALMQEIMVAGKIISGKVRRAGLVLEMGRTGRVNVQGEEVQYLDEFSNETLVRMTTPGGQLCILASEESAEPIEVPPPYAHGRYAMAFDPLDGSSNIEVNVATGTIFSVHRRRSVDGPGTLQDLLQPGRDLVAAGYLIYGSSTMLVYAARQCGVFGFTLDPSIGEFLLSHPNLRIPENGGIYSVNEGHTDEWDDRDRGIVRAFRSRANPSGRALNARYVGSLVTDFHRNLLQGGIYLYPATASHPDGKLRLLYEAAPLGFLCEAAGGLATTGTTRIAEVTPEVLHQRVPLFIGSRREVAFVESVYQNEWPESST
ncbi:MAG: class 1 fructose-bisphosphatase [Candidatus Eisenbacteria bacterium]|uniref:Fructose-1,6-bisphosphatase class 1 n=1 Tax=Eiseniibacteriota bacterium TaxID=2212470 RepID=A0A956LWH0_UNCEI|nr:class 1 fructose-bisphosphatase [Candidatus Eisenbacteria bacterium]